MSAPARKVWRKVWVVEKFLPPDCPNCEKKFESSPEDYMQHLGDIVDGRKIVKETRGYNIIVCSRCDNYTACVPLESYILSDKTRAKRLLKEGFVNLHEARVSDAIKDTHLIFTELSDHRVEGIV